MEKRVSIGLTDNEEALPNVASRIQLLKDIDQKQQNILHVRRELHKLKIEQEIFNHNQHVMSTYEQLNKLVGLLKKFLGKENAISLFLLQNITQDTHNTRLRLASHMQPVLVNFIRNLARLDGQEADIQDLQAISEDKNFLPSIDLKEFAKSITFFKESMQKIKQAYSVTQTEKGQEEYKALIDKLQEFISQIDGQTTLMSLVLNKSC